MAAISFIIFLSIFLSGLSLEFFRQVSSLKFDGLLIMRVNYSIVYGLCPLCVFFFPDLYGERVDLFGLTPAPELLFQIALSCLGAFMVSSFAYRVGSYFNVLAPTVYDRDHLKRTILVIGAFVFVAFNLYTYQYGGFLRTVELSGLIRQGFQDDVLETDGQLLFIQNLTPIAFILLPASYILFSKEKNWTAATFFGLSFVISALVWLILGSRGHIAISLLLLFFCFMKFKYNDTKVIKPGTLVMLIVAAFFLDYFLGIGKGLSSALYREDLTVADAFRDFKYAPLGSLVGYYDEYIASAIVSISMKHVSYTYFYDSLIAPAYLVPSRLFDFAKPESIVYFNTYMVIGAWESVVPPGLIAYGTYALGPVGIVISAAIYGLVLGLLDKANMVPVARKYINTLIITPFVLYWGVYYFQGDPKTLIGTLTSPIMFTLILFVVRTRRVQTAG